MFIKLKRELRNFIIHSEAISITNNEKNWIDHNGEFQYKSSVYIQTSLFTKYLNSKINLKYLDSKTRIELLIDFVESNYPEKLPLSDLLIELKSKMESF